MAKAERNRGIDLLRIVAMLLVIVLHVNGRGGVLKAATGMAEHVAQALEIMAFCSVNVYALISGYVGAVRGGHRRWATGTLSLWATGVFYSLAIALWSRQAGLEDLFSSREGIIRALTPITSGTWWYLTSYVGASFFFPLVADFVERRSERELRGAVLACVLVFSCGTTCARALVPDADPLHLANGYSALWLLVLYFLGYAIRKADMGRSTPSWVLLAGAVLAIACAYGWHYHIDGLLGRGSEDSLAQLLLNYTSPTTLACAVCLLLLFSRLRLDLGERASALFTRLSVATFGVYLIHVHPLVFGQVLPGAFKGMAQLPPALLPLAMLGVALVVLVVCSMADMLRQLVFDVVALPFRARGDQAGPQGHGSHFSR